MTLTEQLEEIQLIQCSLLANERFDFTMQEDQNEAWKHAVDTQLAEFPSSFGPARFRVSVHAENDETYQVECHCQLSREYSPLEIKPLSKPDITIKSAYMTRLQQETWQNAILEKWNEILCSEDTAYPVFQLISTLLPLIQKHLHVAADPLPTPILETQPTIPHHAFLTSHHLIAPSKRRSLQQWTSELGLFGFAKVGYPGIIYVYGPNEADVKEFVSNVKAMQWLALRVRFVEPLVTPAEEFEDEKTRKWVEFTTVGEVVAEMKMLGRELFVLDLGIGSGSGQAARS